MWARTRSSSRRSTRDWRSPGSRAERDSRTSIPPSSLTRDSNYVRLLWNLNELPTDEAAVAWGGDLSIQELNTALWAANNAFVKGMYYRVYFQVALANEFLRQSE